MERGPSTLSWLLPTVLCAGLSVIYLLEWRASRAAHADVSGRFGARVTALESKVSFESVQTRSLLKSLGVRLEDLALRVGELALEREDLAALAELRAVTAPLDVESEPLAEELSREQLPPLPEGIEPLEVMHELDLTKFYGDLVFNPEGVDLPQIDRHRAVHIAEQAQARLMILRSDFQLLAAEEAERMTAEGMYVDYAKGQRREPLPGVYTRGVVLPGGIMRIFAYFPEEYPVLYELKQEMKDVAQEALQRLMALTAA